MKYGYYGWNVVDNLVMMVLKKVKMMQLNVVYYNLNV